MTYEAKSNLTRRQFGWSALGMGAAARLGLGAAALEGLFDARAKGQAAANASDVTGANSLEAHAAARGHLYARRWCRSCSMWRELWRPFIRWLYKSGDCANRDTGR